MSAIASSLLEEIVKIMDSVLKNVPQGASTKGILQRRANQGRGLIMPERTEDERKHFVNFDKCQCAAYQYLAVRILKRSLTVYLIHVKGKERKYLNVAHVKKFALDIHGRESSN
jgi:hypothetical protein